ncbi:PLD nuclease N-terminal domain-containing protein [Curtobacterium flaccumfaciens]|nr:PLD nuclease N-terminal domain-containing protein [Curtobacterium flaccumfaciens]
METSHNAVIPQSYDIAWIVGTVVMFVLLVAALVSIARRAGELRTVLTLVWVLVAIFLPFIGPIAWFVAGNPAAKRRSPSHHRAHESRA